MNFDFPRVLNQCLLLPLLLTGFLAGCHSEPPTSPTTSGSPATGSTQEPTSQGETTSSNAASSNKNTREVTLALNWFPEAEHGGFYAALVHGYYEEEGLKVTIRSGGPKVPVIADVASGVVPFGVDNADKLMLARAQQADAVAVMAPIQDSPRCIMVHKSEGITGLKGLAGRKGFTLAMNSGQPFAQFLMKHVDLSEATIVNYPGNVAQFLLQKEYGQQAYSFSEPFVAEQQQGDPVCLMLSEIGFNTYTSLLITQANLIKEDPDLVTRMTRASIRGWKKYLSEPEESNRHIHELNPQMGMDVLAFGVEALKPLCLPKDFSEERLGEMSPERWQMLTSQMTEVGSIKTTSENESFLKPESAYSTKFVKTEP